MPWDSGPDCGCWGPVRAITPRQLRLVIDDTPPVPMEAQERIRFLRDTYNTTGMTYRTTAIAYNALYGTALTADQVRYLLRHDSRPLKDETLHSLGIAA